MKVIKIGAMWCSGCLLMNNIWNKVLKQYSFDYLELDLDMDEDLVSSYGKFDVLPSFIILNGDTEINRFSGEYKYDDFVKILMENGVIDEENN